MNLFPRWCASQTMSDHPSDLEIELARSDEAEAGTVEHLGSCASCRERLAVLAVLAGDHRLPVEEVALPPDRDEAIRTVARRRAFEVRQRLVRRRLVRLASSVAAAAALLGVLVTAHWKGTSGRPAMAVSLASDLNGDGKVDILDALALARKADHGDADPRWDVNRDGRVDALDVDYVARAAVSLSGPRAG